MNSSEWQEVMLILNGMLQKLPDGAAPCHADPNADLLQHPLA